MISVIVPIYKVERYLEKCIHSIQQNTYKDIEIICINDGSPDGCPKILERLALQDTRIKVINQENRGVTEARNAGLEAATGEYIAFVDSDDWIHPQYFQSLLNCMEKTGANIAVCGCKAFMDGEEVAVGRYARIDYQRLGAEQFFKSYYARHMAWGRLYRRKDIGIIRFPRKVSYSDDTLFNLRVMADLAQPIVYETDGQLYLYCQREGSIVHEVTHNKMAAFPEWVTNNASLIGRGPWSWMIWMQAIKFELSHRYAAKLYKDKRGVRQSNKNLRKLLIKMMLCRQIRIKDKATHLVMTCLPSLYRYYRIKDDPTMLDWENKVKKDIST